MYMLIQRKPVVITLSKRRVPGEYFRTKTSQRLEGDIYVFLDFFARMVGRCDGEEDTKALEPGTRTIIESADVDDNLKPSDSEIESALPENHLCDRSVLCAGLGEIIDMQPGGIAGHLAHTGVTLAYTVHWVVYIYHDGVTQKWTVATWRRGGDRFPPQLPVRRIIWIRIEA